MKRIAILAVLILATLIVLPAYASDPQEQRNKAAFRMILEQADANKDGKLSSKECMAIYKDKTMAEKNCTFWDTNKDGIITVDEYGKQAMSLGVKKKKPVKQGKKPAGDKVTEESMERMLKQATGKDMDVNIQGNDIRVDGDDSKTSISKASVWPADMFKEVPKLTEGKIEHVTKTNEGGNRSFNLFLTDIPDKALNNYDAALKDKGWQTQIMDMGESRMISAQKDSLGLNFSVTMEDRKGTLSVFSYQ